MGAIVKVRNVKLGDGMPKICIPVTDTNLNDLKKSVNLIRNTPFDLIEWRADFYDGVEDPDVWILLNNFRRQKSDCKPLSHKRSYCCKLIRIKNHIWDYMISSEVFQDKSIQLRGFKLKDHRNSFQFLR